MIGIILFMLIVLLIGAFIVGAFMGIGKGVKGNIERAQTASEIHADIKGVAKHVSGLPMAQGVQVDVYAKKDGLVVKKDAQDVSLPAARIKDIDTVTGKDLQGQMAGAAAGALIFGMAGAAVGALTASSKYMIVTYESKDGDTKYITLDVSLDPSVTSRIKKYCSMGQTESHTEL